MLAPERPQTHQGAESSAETREVGRRADALLQARRIEEYLPTLEARAEDLQWELRETRALIRDERKALADLKYEGEHILSQCRIRYQKQGRESPI